MNLRDAGIREILALNMKENRRKNGFSQERLAEKAGISTPFVAMIEVSRKFPSPEMLDRLAKALGIEAYQLFIVKSSPETAMERLHDTLVCNIEQVINDAVEKAINTKCPKKHISNTK